jgi:hypothetical protein
MKANKHWVWLLLFGALWGINEVLMGEAFPKHLPTWGSVWLAAWAFLVLATARALWNRPGSSFLIALVAGLFRAVNAAPFFCHILGIALLGLAFDATASLLLRGEKKGWLRCGLTGLLGVYLGKAFFALTVTYVIRYSYWVEAGSSKVLDHIFVNGSLAALAAALLVPLGFRLGLSGKTLTDHRPGWACAGGLVLTLILWVLGAM